jgi:hypothetical protein
MRLPSILAILMRRVLLSGRCGGPSAAMSSCAHDDLEPVKVLTLMPAPIFGSSR